MRRAQGRKMQRKRNELVERTFAHMCETGGGRRTWLRGLEKVRKRWLMQAAARNLGLLLRRLFGIGTARALQAAGGLALRLYFALLHTLTVGRLIRMLVALKPQITLSTTHTPAVM